jgi:energy-coupling factor transporter transmembrane protein EcfT
VTPLLSAARLVLTVLDRFWAPIVLVVLVGLVVGVFVPRQMFEAIVVAAIVGAAVAIAGLAGSSL